MKIACGGSGITHGGKATWTEEKLVTMAQQLITRSSGVKPLILAGSNSLGLSRLAHNHTNYWELLTETLFLLNCPCLSFYSVVVIIHKSHKDLQDWKEIKKQGCDRKTGH